MYQVGGWKTMITPNDIREIEIEQCDFDKLEKDIDNSIKSNHGIYAGEEALLDKEYPLSVRNEIGKRYMENGWKYVYHRTSSENGERPGLTSFIFSEVPVKHLEECNTGYVKVHQMLPESKNEYKRGWHDALSKALDESYTIHSEEGIFQVVQAETLIGLGYAVDDPQAESDGKDDSTKNETLSKV